MPNLKYEIHFNENNNPYIDLDKDSDDDSAAHKFMAYQLTIYSLYDLIERNNKLKNLTEESKNAILITYDTLLKISHEIGLMIKEQMTLMGDLEDINDYYFSVENKDELLNLKYGLFVVNNKIFTRKEGLRVLVKDENNIYELVGGIDNINWNIKSDTKGKENNE